MCDRFLAFLIGTGLQVLATGAFWVVAVGCATGPLLPRQALKRFYGAELLKWVIVVAGFSGIWSWGIWDPLAVLLGFFVPQLLYWKFLFWRQSGEMCLISKVAEQVS